MATIVCKRGHYFRAVSLAVAVLSLLLVVVDRYIAIVLPFKAIYVRTRLRVALLLFAWTLPLLIFIPYASSSEIIQGGHQTFCRTFVSWNKTEQSVFFSVGFFILHCVPLFSIIVLYSRIMKSLRQTTPGGKEQENVRTRKLQQNQIVMKVFVWIVSAFFICWTPLCVYIVLKKIVPTSHFAEDPCMVFVGLFFYVFPTLSTVVNPLILFAFSWRFRKTLKDMFSCFSCRPWQCCKSERVSPQHVVDMYRL